MKFTASNIGWTIAQDDEMFSYLASLGCSGVEIAPTRLVTNQPYDHLETARAHANRLKSSYGLDICSMQSIWFGRRENLFGSEEERAALLDYTFKAIDFASAIACPNLVFGSPVNRNRGEASLDIAYDFFSRIAKAASEKGTIIALEPNPTLYHTDFITTTKEAAEFISVIDEPGLRLNLDFGTLLANETDVDTIIPYLNLVNHVHISECFLESVQKRTAHSTLMTLLKNQGYAQYVSIEMKWQSDLSAMKSAVDYLSTLVK